MAVCCVFWFFVLLVGWFVVLGFFCVCGFGCCGFGIFMFDLWLVCGLFSSLCVFGLWVVLFCLSLLPHPP